MLFVGVGGIFLYGDSVQGDLACLRLIQMEEQLDKGGLSRAVVTHKGDLLPLLDLHAHILQRRLFCTSVGKGNSGKLNITLSCFLACFHAFNLGVVSEEETVILNVHSVVPELCHNTCHTGKGPRNLSDRVEYYKTVTEEHSFHHKCAQCCVQHSAKLRDIGR